MKFIINLMQTYNKGKLYDALLKKYQGELATNKSLAEVAAQQLVLQNKYDSLKEQYELLLNAGKLNILDLIDWFEGNRNKDSWIYDGVRLGSVDVKKYLVVSEDGQKVMVKAADELIAKFSLTKDSLPEEIPRSLMKHFKYKSNWTYKYDKDKFGKPEFWQSADKSWIDKEGDCDDLAILMHVLAYFIFLKLKMLDHYRRLTFTCGKLAGEGGHAFNTWLHDDGQYYVVESTFDLDGSYYKTWLRTPIKYNNMYQTFWGFATIYRSWKGSNSFFDEYVPKKVEA